MTARECLGDLETKDHAQGNQAKANHSKVEGDRANAAGRLRRVTERLITLREGCPTCDHAMSAGSAGLARAALIW